MILVYVHGMAHQLAPLGNNDNCCALLNKEPMLHTKYTTTLKHTSPPESRKALFLDIDLKKRDRIFEA